MARKPTDQVQLKLRFDEKLRRKLELAAERADRSMNAEIIYRLEQSFADSDILTRIEKKMDEIKDGIQETQDQQYERFLRQLNEQNRAEVIRQAETLEEALRGL